MHGEGCIDLYFLDLCTGQMWAGSFAALSLYPRGKRPLYPLDRRQLGGPQSWSGWYAEETIFDPMGTWTLISPLSSVQPATIPTVLPWLFPFIVYGQIQESHVCPVDCISLYVNEVSCVKLQGTSDLSFRAVTTCANWIQSTELVIMPHSFLLIL